jgi:hypothetical protein
LAVSGRSHSAKRPVGGPVFTDSVAVAELRSPPFLDQRCQCQADAGVGAQEPYRRAFAIDPFSKLLYADVGPVLMVGGQRFDPLAES